MLEGKKEKEKQVTVYWGYFVALGCLSCAIYIYFFLKKKKQNCIKDIGY